MTDKLAKLTKSLRSNGWLLVSAWLAWVGAATIGYINVLIDTTTPWIWLPAMWIMLAAGLCIVVAVALEALSAFTGSDGGGE